MSKAALESLERALLEWPVDDLKPLIDVLRIGLQQASMQRHFFGGSEETTQALVSDCCERNCMRSRV